MCMNEMRQEFKFKSELKNEDFSDWKKEKMRHKVILLQIFYVYFSKSGEIFHLIVIIINK